MAYDPATGKEQEGYVDLDPTDDEPIEISEVDEVVLEDMPADEERILEREPKDVGFGEEPNVVVDTSGDRLAKYKD